MMSRVLAEDVVVGDHDALGLAGGAGSPHDGGQVAAGIDHRRKQRRRRPAGPRATRPAERTPSFCRQRLQLRRQQGRRPRCDGRPCPPPSAAAISRSRRWAAARHTARPAWRPGRRRRTAGRSRQRCRRGRPAPALRASSSGRPGVHQGAKLAVADRFLAADDGGRAGLSAGKDPLRRVGDRFVHAKRFPSPSGRGPG